MDCRQGILDASGPEVGPLDNDLASLKRRPDDKLAAIVVVSLGRHRDCLTICADGRFDYLFACGLRLIFHPFGVERAGRVLKDPAKPLLARFTCMPIVAIVRKVWRRALPHFESISRSFFVSAKCPDSLSAGKIHSKACTGCICRPNRIARMRQISSAGVKGRPAMSCSARLSSLRSAT